MPLKGTLTVGSSCRLTIDSAPTMPGTSAVAIVWIPKPSATTPAPVVTAVAPGSRMQKTVIVPDAQLLLLDVDLPVDHASSVTIAVEQGANTVATGAEPADTEWTFLVVP